ncbi:MAG: hypothetical protein M1389_01330, partial [Chloroflexi bacterium]|nr:hypothetical protein [Chloroflexota bacterium]
AMKPFERAVISSHLQLFTNMLEKGETVQLAPEGAVSRDGHFARIRAGLHVLLNLPRTQVRVLPVGITYDFMTSGRQRVFVNVGREITDLRGLKPADASARIAEAILAQSTITGSQLASELVLSVRSQGGGALSGARLIEHVAEQANRWSRAGLFVDPRLLNGELGQRMEQYAEYCVRSGELVARGPDYYWVRRRTEQPSPSWTNPSGAVSYTNNELTSLRRLLGGV